MEAEEFLDLPIDEIFRKKLQYHVERRKKLNEEIMKHLEEERKLINFLSGAIKLDEKKHTSTKTVEPEKNEKRTSEVSQKTVRPIIEKWMATHEGVITTDEIFRSIQKELNIPESDRVLWITPISQSLAHMEKYGRVKSYPFHGRSKKYEFIGSKALASAIIDFTDDFEQTEN